MSGRWNLTLPALLVVGLIGAPLAGCNLLEAENPNNLIEEDLGNPQAATPMANGAEATVTRALNAVMGPFSTATDEVTWVGSRNAWQELDQGFVDRELNEFSDAAFPFVGEARWTVDNYVERLEAFRADGASVAVPLARVYLYKAIIYATIADMFDNFAFSDRTEPGPAIGEENMVTLYDQALDAVNKGLALNVGGNWDVALTAMRASLKYRKALWQKLNPTVNTANPLVGGAELIQDALAAIDLMGLGSDWRFVLEMDPSLDDLVADNPEVGLAYNINQRNELRIGATYVEPNPVDGGKTYSAITFTDIIDTDTVNPFLEAFLTQFTDDAQYGDVISLSEREMHLIAAEAELAAGNVPGFTTHINHIRAMDDLTPYSGQVEPLEMLKHARQVNLFLQGRRLADHYRFQEPSPEWVPSSTAMQQPGTFLPITFIELSANPLLGGG
ncbi:hypothetical protein AWN76_003770 [Rhodothermaceae bacterium RA]|nr:hypothetical protein AWN76_003770 [Rhodothermaceae bacterium RA]